MLVLKTSYGAFVSPHSNGKELNISHVTINDAYKFDTIEQVRELFKKFQGYWIEYKIEVHEVILSSKRINLF